MPLPMQTEAAPDWQLRRSADLVVVDLTGDWSARSGQIPTFPADALAGMKARQTLRLDSGKVTNWDSGLIAFLWDVKRAATAAGVVLDSAELPSPTRTLLGLLPDRLVEQLPAATRRHFRPLAWVGDRTVGSLTELGALSTLLGSTAQGGVRALNKRASMRTVDLLGDIRDAGPAALFIVSVVNFLVGAIVAFVGAVQLRKFAADIYIADLVGLAVVREMSAMMTAIIMSGRTGGAYAARIATMQGNEEIDALQVIGIPVADYILLPAILALLFTMPFLYLYGCVVGMIGGWIVSIAMLNVTSAGYLAEILGAVPLDQFVFGFIKSMAFAVLIGVTSCHVGLKSGRSSADVGIAATRAVVMGIVGVIALDAVFAVVADVVGI